MPIELTHTFASILDIEKWLLDHHQGGCKVHHHMRRALAQAVQARILRITHWENHQSVVAASWNEN